MIFSKFAFIAVINFRFPLDKRSIDHSSQIGQQINMHVYPNVNFPSSIYIMPVFFSIPFHGCMLMCECCVVLHDSVSLLGV